MKIRMTLVTSLALVLSLLFSCQAPPPPPFEANTTLTMYIATDIHYREYDPSDDQIVGSAKLFEYIPDLLYALKYDMSNEKPNYLLVTGDLTDTGANYAQDELVTYFTEVEAQGTQVLVMPGNHDFASAAFAEKFAAFGYADAYMREGLSYCARLSADTWIVTLDTGVYGQLQDDTLAFFEKVGAAAQKENARLLVASHHNAVPHLPTMNDGFVLWPADQFYAIMAKYALPVDLTGHMHAQDIASRTDGAYQLTDICTGALAVYPHRVGVMTLSPTQWEYNTRSLPVEEYAKLSADTQTPELLDFATYSRDYHMGRFAKRGDVDDISEEAATLRGLINVHYFEGDENQYFEQLKDDGAWEELKATRYYNFLQEALFDKDLPDNHWVHTFS